MQPAMSSASAVATTKDQMVLAPADAATITGVAAIAADGAAPETDCANTSTAPSRRRSSPCTGELSRSRSTPRSRIPRSLPARTAPSSEPFTECGSVPSVGRRKNPTGRFPGCENPAGPDSRGRRSGFDRRRDHATVVRPRFQQLGAP